MDLLSGALLALSISLSAGRNALSRSFSDTPFGKRAFFLMQATIFLSGSTVLLICDPDSPAHVSSYTLILSAIYALLLLGAQWFYTVALGMGSIGLCATVYSLGFIIPTAAGMIIWQEPISAAKIAGICTAVLTVILTGLTKKSTGAKSRRGAAFFPSILAAMLSSGGLGIIQKIQQSSKYAEEKTAFIFYAFMLAAIISFATAIAAALISRSADAVRKRKYAFAGGAGICFALCNLLNTVLAGRLASAVFFPMLNICSIILSVILGILVFGEKLTRGHICTLSLAAISILLICCMP